jgi:hypothetical protein
VAGDVQQVSKTISNLGQVGESPSCNSTEKPAPASATKRAARVECPAFLKSAYIKEDRYQGFRDESASESCRVALSSANRASVAQIESRLSKNSASGLGAPEQFLEKCLEPSVSVQHWQVTMPPSMPGAPMRPWTKTTEEHLGENEKKALTAEYYLSMNRLRTGSQSALETVAAIDSTLGQKPLADRRCDDSRLPGIDDTCRRLQACAPSNALAAQAAELDQVLPLVHQLEAKKSQGEATRGLSYLGQAYGGSAAQANAVRAEADAAIGEASKQLQVYKSLYPALDGKEFRKTFDPKKKNTEEALRMQLEATRERVIKQLDSYHKGMNCLNSPFSCSADCEEYPKALAHAPQFRAEAFKSGEGATDGDRDVQSYLMAAECRQGIRTTQKEAGDVVKDFAIGAGLTIATAGIGTVAAGAKAATTVAQGSRIANLASKAGLARAAILGGDLYFAADGVNKAIDQCAESLNQLSSEPGAASNSGCPGAEDSKQVQVMADYRACVLSAVTSVGPNLLPFVPAFVKAYRSGARRVAWAKPTVPGRGSTSGLAPTHRLPEERLLSLSPEARTELVKNMELGDRARVTKISERLGLPAGDPKVKKLIQLHADPRYSGTLEGSTTELQKKIDDAMEIVVPGYGKLPPEARRAHSAKRVEVTDLVRKGVLGKASPEVQQTVGRVAQADIKIRAQLAKYQKSPASIQQQLLQFRSSSIEISEKVPAEFIVKRVNRMHGYLDEMKKNIELLRGAGFDAGDEIAEKLVEQQIAEIKKQLLQLEPEIKSLRDIRKPDFQKYRAFGSDEGFDPSAASKELQELLKELRDS